MRKRLSFRPQVEQSEARMLLSAAGVVQAATVGTQFEMREGSAGAFTSPFVRLNTPIYSFYVVNRTERPLDIAISASNGKLNPGSLREFPQPLANLGGSIILFTDDPNNTFTMTITPVDAPWRSARFEFHSHEAPVTSLEKGYDFPTSSELYHADALLSARFVVVAHPTVTGPLLRVVRV
jgi:hypothetical protein